MFEQNVWILVLWPRQVTVLRSMHSLAQKARNLTSQPQACSPGALLIAARCFALTSLQVEKVQSAWPRILLN